MKLFQEEIRNLELYQKYLQYREEGVSHRQSIRLAVNSSCSRYWVSPFYIYRAFLDKRNRNNRGTSRKSVRSTRKEMERQIFKDYKKLSKQKEFKGCSFYFLVCFLINRPAPSFYISEDRATKIICQMRKSRSVSAKYRRRHHN